MVLGKRFHAGNPRLVVPSQIIVHDKSLFFLFEIIAFEFFVAFNQLKILVELVNNEADFARLQIESAFFGLRIVVTVHVQAAMLSIGRGKVPFLK